MLIRALLYKDGKLSRRAGLAAYLGYEDGTAVPIYFYGEGLSAAEHVFLPAILYENLAYPELLRVAILVKAVEAVASRVSEEGDSIKR